MAKKEILLVEDEADMAELVCLRLQREGYAVACVADGRQALERILRSPPDLVLLDIMLPGMSGLEVLREVRSHAATRRLGVILLTARSESLDVVVGLKIGADDYVTKPFNMSVLLARVAAVLRRAADLAGETAASAAADKDAAELALGLVRVDRQRHAVHVGPHAVTLTPTEFRLLVCLLLSRGRVLTRDQLIDQTLGLDAAVTDRTIDVHMTALRRKLGAAREYLKTIRGIGYRFAVEES